MPRWRPGGRLAVDLTGRFAARFAGADVAFRAGAFFLAALFCAVFRFVAFAFGLAVDFRAFAGALRFAAPREGFAADGVLARRDGFAAFAACGFAGFRADGFPAAGAAEPSGVAVSDAAVPPSPEPPPVPPGSAIDDQSASLRDWSVGGRAMLANRQRSRNLMSFSL